MDAVTVRAQLKEAVDNNDFAAFNSAYQAFLTQFSSFRDTIQPSGTTGAVEFRNPIFGDFGFGLKRTEDEAAVNILNSGKQASNAFAKVPMEDRLRFLEILKQKITDHQDAITLTITADTGKPVDLATGEMAKGNEWFKATAELAASQGRHTDKFKEVRRPLGVTQIIGAYNYPYALAIGGITGALAGGNSVVVSAPMKAPDWVFPFKEAADEAMKDFLAEGKAAQKPWVGDLEKHAAGLIQTSIGINETLTKNADVVHFVGSNQTGEHIKQLRGNKRTILEMGGSNVVTVMASALNPERTAETIAETIYAGFGPATGQRCTAPRILCVQYGAEGVSEALKHICTDSSTRVDKDGNPEMGNPFNKGVKMGPLVDHNAYLKMQQAIALAEQLGATVSGQLHATRNKVPQAENEGTYWVNPIVIDWKTATLDTEDKVARVHACLEDEIFGPLVHIVHSVKDLQGAIDMANKLDHHKLAGALFTGDENDVEKYSFETNVTSLAVNGAPKDQSPTSVHGHPGMLKIGGKNHLDLYTDIQVIATIGKV